MNLEAFKQPVNDTAPCGADLENGNDPRWLQLNTLAAGEKKEGIVQPPKWTEVRDLALELAQETRHLRLGVILTECATFLEGLTGFAGGLGLIRAWCEQFWDDVYPAGEPEDKRDFRPPVLEALNYPSFLVKMKGVPVSKSAGGRFSIGDLQAAVEADQNDGDAANQARLVQGTFSNTPPEIIQENLAALSTALEHARAIESIFDDKFGYGYGVNFGDLRDTLNKMIELIRTYAPSAGGAPAESSNSAGADTTAAGMPSPFQPVAASGAIHSRESAIAVLDKVIEWFEKNEPSSPIPFLLKRAQRCVGMNFIQLMDELANDRSQAETVLKP
jgi:type VI secretion system protein ImpA